MHIGLVIGSQERLVTTMGKHLTLDDRIQIQEGLNNELSVGRIAKNLGKSTSTIAREIDRHKVSQGRATEKIKSLCTSRENCRIRGLCPDMNCKRLCRDCISCMDFCDQYNPSKCKRLEQSPYVCNGCSRTSCPYERTSYIATYAQDVYEKKLIESREGINQDPETIQEADKLISPLLKKGQPLSHIYANHAEEIEWSRSTMYTYISKGLFSARDMDLPRKVSYRPRRRKTVHTPTAEEKEAVRLRDYRKFEEFMQQNPDASVVEMDTVVGPKHSKKAILTLFFRSCSLMIMLLLERKTQENVIAALNWLCDAIGIDCFRRFFQVILTDRGTEFLYPEAIECDENGEIKTRLFYCDPQCSWQKGMLEKNHEYIRFIVPKKVGTFDHLDQADVTLMANHINSISRDKLNRHSPFIVSKYLLDGKIHQALGFTEIPPDEICLKPELLGNRGQVSYWKRKEQQK